MTTETDIANMALIRLGEPVISTIDEVRKGAQLCKVALPMVRDRFLRMHPWNFSIRRTELSLVTPAPLYEYGYAFQLPDDCLRVLRTNYETAGYSSKVVYTWGYEPPGSIEYRIEGRRLLMNEPTCRIEYVAKVTDPAEWDVLFADLVAQGIAMEIGMTLTNNAALMKNVQDAYVAKLNEARSMNAQEGAPREIFQNDGWLLSRF